MNAPNELSFLPDDYLERKAQRRTNAIFATLFLIMVCAIGAAFTMRERLDRTARGRHADLEQRYADAARRIGEVRQMQDKQRKMALQAELTASLLEKVPRGNLLAELTNDLPTGVSLIDFALDSRLVQGPPPPVYKTMYEQKKAEIEAAAKGLAHGSEPRKYEVGMHLTGVAGTDVLVAQFMHNLQRSKLLKDVNLVIVEEFQQGQEKVRRFQIEMTLDPEARVQPEEQPRKITTAGVDAGGGL